jgi:hypothetical protein
MRLHVRFVAEGYASEASAQRKACRSAGFDAYCSRPLAHGELGKVLDEARANSGGEKPATASMVSCVGALLAR